MNTIQRLAALGYTDDGYIPNAGHVIAQKGGQSFTAGDIITELLDRSDDLLAALQDLLPMAECLHEVPPTRVQAARAAIAKAIPPRTLLEAAARYTGNHPGAIKVRAAINDAVVADEVTRRNPLLTSGATIRLVIHVEDGLVQGVLADAPVEYLVADCDCDGEDDDGKIATPATLRKAIGGAKEMFGRDGGRTFSHEADVNPAAVADTYNLPFKD